MSESQKPFTQEIFVVGKELLETIKRLVNEGNARSIRIKSEDGKILLEIPLNTGLVLGGAMVFLAPFFAAISGIVALYKRVKVEVVMRDDDKADEARPVDPQDDEDR